MKLNVSFVDSFFIGVAGALLIGHIDIHIILAIELLAMALKPNRN